MNNNQSSQESLFLNTLVFEFPKEPVTFYFSETDCKNAHFTRIRSSVLFPANIHSILPKLKNNDTIYTSFSRHVANTIPLEIDFNLRENFHLVKRYYNDKINRFFVLKNILVQTNFIGDNQIWLFAEKRDSYTLYDRFTLKINYNEHLNTPELLISYDRQAKVLNKSLAQLISETNSQNDDIFADNDTNVDITRLINRVVQRKSISGQKEKTREKIIRYYQIGKLINDGENIDYTSLFPILNNPLSYHFGISIDSAEERSSKKNRYLQYLDKITQFRDNFLITEYFQNIIPVSDSYTSVEAGKVNVDSRQLMFGTDVSGQRTIDILPQRGINFGPYCQPRHASVQIFFIVPRLYRESALLLHEMLKNGYGSGWSRFENLQKYLGIPFTTANNFSLVLENQDNPIPEITDKLEKRRDYIIDSIDTKFIAIYLSPISKDCKNRQQFQTYFRIKELLLRWGIASQFIDVNRMIQTLEKDKAQNKNNFSYYLQNIAIAVNAKLGGTPWRIATPLQRELIVGVGAFKNIETNTNYIGSAFSFDNTGAFKSFEYFQKDELLELAGAIQNAIINYKNTIQMPQRLIIHFYKTMSAREVEVIEKALCQLDVEIPIFIVAINKTESEDVIIFDDNYDAKMPYSGRFVNLGNNQYLLCNNTRYDDNSQSYIESFPFPIKLKISCPSDPYLLNQNTIVELIEQVYQFSRIYWKSIRQQNLPVTIKYPEMVAQIAPYFTDGIIPHNIGNDNLWFL